MTYVGIEALLGKTLKEVKKNHDDTALLFTTTEDEVYLMYHQQDCCETVYIEDIAGDLDCLIGYPITLAEEASNSGLNEEYRDSETWTYYKLATVKCYVTIRWYGSSNGYYSESVDFIKANDERDVREVKYYFGE